MNRSYWTLLSLVVGSVLGLLRAVYLFLPGGLIVEPIIFFAAAFLIARRKALHWALVVLAVTTPTLVFIGRLIVARYLERHLNGAELALELARAIGLAVVGAAVGAFAGSRCDDTRDPLVSSNEVRT